MSRPIARRLKGEIAPGYRLRRVLHTHSHRLTPGFTAFPTGRPVFITGMGEGRTVNQAVAQLGEEIVEHYRFLEQHAATGKGFSGSMARQLHWLRRNLIREGG